MKLLATFLANIDLGYAEWTKVSPPPPEEFICPSIHQKTGVFAVAPHKDGCYTQDKVWSPGKPVECEMTNPHCLVVECTGSSMKAQMLPKLFHTNDQNTENFMTQLKNGTRKLKYNDNELKYGEDCGFKFKKPVMPTGQPQVGPLQGPLGGPYDEDRWITIDWSFEDCPFNTPIIDGNDIVYNVLLSSPGNAPGIADIEFYVDTSVNIECRYDRNITIDAEGFWVNQEDVNMKAGGSGTLEGVAECKLFTDVKRENQIDSNSIVNMGTKLYGMVDSHLKMPGLQYKLTDVIVSDGNTDNNTGKSFKVIDAGKLSTYVDAQSTGSAMTGSDVFFSYLAFGFENLDNQNQLKIVCTVSVEPVPPQSMLFLNGIGNPLLISDTNQVDLPYIFSNAHYDFDSSCGVTFRNQHFIFAATIYPTSTENVNPVLKVSDCELETVALLDFRFSNGACGANNDKIMLCFAVDGLTEQKLCRQWTNGQSMDKWTDLVPSIYYHADTSIALSQDGFLAVGGSDVKAEMYDFTTNGWTEVADYPAFGISMYDMLYLADIDAYVVIGGRDDSARRRRSDSGPTDSGLLGDINMFQNGAWTNIGKLNTPRGGHVAQMVNGMLIVAGGEEDDYPTEKCIFDDETDQFICTDIEPTLSIYGEGISFVVPQDYCVNYEG